MRLTRSALAFVLCTGIACSQPPAPTPEPADADGEDSTASAEDAQRVTIPADLGLVGNRFSPLRREEMTDAQLSMVSSILAGPRTSLGGPFNVLLRRPEWGDTAQELGGHIRFNADLPAPLREMAIIMTGRFWRADYEWYVHKNAALGAGLAPAIAEAIAEGRRPDSMSAEETALYDLAHELLYDRRTTQPTFDAAIQTFGEEGVVDIVGTLGYYSLVSLLLNVDEYPLPEGVEPELAPLQ